MTEKDFDDVISANLKSVFNYTKAVLRPMIQQKYGRIINIASVVGLIRCSRGIRSSGIARSPGR